MSYGPGRTPRLHKAPHVSNSRIRPRVSVHDLELPSVARLSGFFACAHPLSLEVAKIPILLQKSDP